MNNPKKANEKDAQQLRRELMAAWKAMETLPITEIAARNDGVLEYCRHWEGRAEKAEQQLDACASECLGLRSTMNDQHQIIMDLQSKGHRLALELECLLNDTKDTAIQSKWWDSAHEALEEWRK